MVTWLRRGNPDFNLAWPYESLLAPIGLKKAPSRQPWLLRNFFLPALVAGTFYIHRTDDRSRLPPHFPMISSLLILLYFALKLRFPQRGLVCIYSLRKTTLWAYFHNVLSKRGKQCDLNKTVNAPGIQRGGWGWLICYCSWLTAAGPPSSALIAASSIIAGISVAAPRHGTWRYIRSRGAWRTVKPALFPLTGVECRYAVI